MEYNVPPGEVGGNEETRSAIIGGNVARRRVEHYKKKHFSVKLLAKELRLDLIFWRVVWK